MEEVYEFLNKNISTNEYIVIGVSGGADSMMLLALLESVSNNIVCAHIHHNLRPESDEEEQFVRMYCASHNIIFETTKFEYDDKFSEKVAREKRYAFFEEILNKYGSKTLLTAHHGDDLIETILMRLVRGSTMKGYAGIELISDREAYKIYRPLLYLTKEDIYTYLRENNIDYREDRTNDDDQYTRNRYRKNILPLLKEENEQVHLKFLNYSNELLDYFYYVQEEIEDKYNKIVSDGINIEKFNGENPFIQKGILKKYLFSVYNQDIEKITSGHIDSIIALINKGESNTWIDLPCYRAMKYYEEFKIIQKEEQKGYSLSFFGKKLVLPNGMTIEEIRESEETSNFVTYLDSEDFETPITIRTYQDGDKMTVKNMDGHKKISDIFTDEKIKLDERERWPILVDNSGKVIWLPGLKKSHFDKKKNEKYDIILKYY